MGMAEIGRRFDAHQAIVCCLEIESVFELLKIARVKQGKQNTLRQVDAIKTSVRVSRTREGSNRNSAIEGTRGGAYKYDKFVANLASRKN